LLNIVHFLKGIFMNVTPASNVTAGAFGGFVTVLVLHVCAANNIVIPPDVADSLPYAFAVVIAHLYDMLTGGNAKPGNQQSETQSISAAPFLAAAPGGLCTLPQRSPDEKP
jgi:ABC-type uncharacterized transport system permease subunit